MLAIQRFTVTGAIDAAVRLYKDHFKTLFTVSLIVSVPGTLGGLVFETASFRLRQASLSGSPDMSLVLAAGGSFVLVLLIGIIAGMFGLAAATRIASTAALGQTPSLKEGLEVAWRAFPALLGATLLVSLAATMGMFLLIVPGFIIYLGFSFVAPIVVLEGHGAVDAMSRSWQLTKGRRWKILGTIILFSFMVGTVTGGIAFAGIISGLVNQHLWANLVQTLLTQAVSALATPVWYVAAVLLYYDARVEREAFDVEMLSRSLDPSKAGA